ncbi:MFS transporter [Amycolatopsis sp. PS_44_ISF1]|uniref:MFS transporter n=1 Tax=Amycolatopsis sp. PS_44_ISF1 TaxID=2974917 RepID=UPI0028DFE883|nr:MFS transporter [Amycolatopsis sp. PS_44_ISF1]MDT8913021.1 MFS transporter [Amycolatopsis sp. PS_44_ISF1]
MQGEPVLRRQFTWLWAAYAVSAFGTWLAFDAFPVLAIRVLHAGPGRVSLLAAAGLAVGAVLALPLGPWVEFRRKQPVMIAMDLVRCAALLTVPLAYVLNQLVFVQLLLVSVLVSAADITFTAASGARLKSLVPEEDLLAANGRFESTTWTATLLGPPLGGAAIGLLGPVVTVVANAAGFALSAAGIRAIGGGEPHPARAPGRGLRAADLAEGWRFLLTHPSLRPLFFNVLLVNGLIMAAAPLMAVLMLGELGFAPWEYGLAFAAPGIGGLVGSRLARRLAGRFGRHHVLLTAGALRAGWPLGLVFVRPGAFGLVLVIAVEFGLITCCAVFNPVLATHRLRQVPADRITRTLSAWSIAGKAVTATLTALGGGLAGLTGPRAAVGLAGLALLATPLLLLSLRDDRSREPGPVSGPGARRGR